MIAERDLSIDSLVVAGKQHVACDVGGELVMLSLDTGEYYGMNSVAAKIWNLIQTETPISAVRDRLLDEYDVTVDRLTEDLFDVLSQFLEWGLIEVRPAR